MVPFNLKVLGKFGLWSNCSQKFDECSLDCARKIFFNCSHTRILVKMCSILVWQIGKHARALNVSGNMRARFAGVSLKLTYVRILRERHPQR